MIIRQVLLGSLAAFGFAAGIAGIPQPASASTDELPGGSWRQSCDKAYVRNGTLHARCRRDGGNNESASVQIGSCRAFGNRNGTLFCESSDGSGGNAGQWSGAFRDSCRDFSVDKHGKLQATCRKNNGTYKRSNLQATKCPSYRARNSDGNLTCEPSETVGNNASRWDGSFRSSCRDISADANGTLTATCQAANGSWRRTSLSSRQCGSHRAGNRDGNLFCESSETSGSSASRWDGSFRGSCRDISADANGTLTATCQAANGSWRRTSLSSRQCGSYRAGNRDGNLFCETSDGTGQNVSQWGGSFSKSCRDISVDSNGMLTANCQRINGAWNRSSLSSRECDERRAGNRDGTLFCER
ncbi:MAG: CVNH domain-containing protein [Steroidobacteraceae bacterium]|nr:CVNH domain-containing protein [Steroidobacteraceae bacterium]